VTAFLSPAFGEFKKAAQLLPKLNRKKAMRLLSKKIYFKKGTLSPLTQILS